MCAHALDTSWLDKKKIVLIIYFIFHLGEKRVDDVINT